MYSCHEIKNIMYNEKDEVDFMSNNSKKENGMSDAMIKFLELLSSDSELMKRYKALEFKDFEDMQERTISFAKDQGIELHKDDFNKPNKESLSDDDLDLVSGGFSDLSCILLGDGDYSDGCIYIGASDIVKGDIESRF